MIKCKQSVLSLFVLGLIFSSCGFQSDKKSAGKIPASDYYSERYRPQIHFSPKANWMNDPNGMVYFEGEYHLFYQYYPDSSVWGPMHWGHAVSKDLVNWEHLPVALYPDSLGYIFSGSAVVDVNNTTGFGKDSKPPLVAIYTYHNMMGEKAGRNDYQTQGIAYSNDDGRTWEKYAGNPVLRNPGIRDFRDPKVMWYEPSQKWIMTLATLDCISFFSSSDLKSWKKESEFGKEFGGHGGVWECPDLFPIKVEGTDQKKWVLLVSINPGGPNGGSATQYFVGNFDGKVFQNENKGSEPSWVDYGKDNYAGVTWSNIPKTDSRRILIGWMSNWQYANIVPTNVWRSAMTLPRELKLVSHPNEGFVLKGYLTAEFENIGIKWENLQTQSRKYSADSPATFALGKADAFDYEVELGMSGNDQAIIELSNIQNEKVDIVLDKTLQQLRVNRFQSGEQSFSADFPAEIKAPANINDTVLVRVVIDQSSVEVFLDEGMLQVTNIVFPLEIYNKVTIKSGKEISVIKSKVRKLKSIWR